MIIHILGKVKGGEGKEMEWETTWNDPLMSYVVAFEKLIGY